MALQYLSINIKPLEERLKESVKKARQLVRTKAFKEEHGVWRIGKEGDPMLPSAKGTTKADGEEGSLWKFDMWLPRAVAKAEGYEASHPWWTVLRDYSNADSGITLPLWQCHERMLKERDLVEIYRERMRMPPIVTEMEQRGITFSLDRMEELENDFGTESKRRGERCVEIAKSRGYELALPKGASPNKSLRQFAFEELKLTSPYYTDGGDSAFNKDAIKYWLGNLEEGEHLEFVRLIDGKRRRDTALGYMQSYRKFMLPIEDDWYLMHASLNMTGTDTLRWSSQGPNEQQISKQSETNVRYIFGPLPGREWWSLDYENLELRIPAYEVGEKSLLELFERPHDPPYFGSNHLLFAHLIHDNKCECRGCKATKTECGLGMFEAASYGRELSGKHFKELYADTWYQWTKNGDFAVQYGAIETSGTADRAYNVVGAQSKIQGKLRNISGLNQEQIRLANIRGYVETIPDVEVNPRRGYPLYCSRSEWGKVSPTVPLNYHVQGTACWVMMRAMDKVYQHIRNRGLDVKIQMQIHDELVLDLPYVEDEGNRQKVETISRIMGSLGECIGVNLTCGVKYHPINWAEAV
jgi:DNA polymerase-1